jgi:multidrug efflux pump subunit AcrA (membrane-fusion protein)
MIRINRPPPPTTLTDADRQQMIDLLNEELNAVRQQSEAQYWQMITRLEEALDLAHARLAQLRATNAENRHLRRLLQGAGIFVTGIGESLTVERTERPTLHETDVREGNIAERSIAHESTGILSATIKGTMLL